MAEFIQGLDPAKLVLIQTALSFSISIANAPVYNLPIFLFGIYAHESPEGSQSLTTFTGLLAGSAFYDIVWMIQNRQNGFIRLITVAILLLKLPTIATFALALRQRGIQFSNFGRDASGPAVWSMPGGFTAGGREGYQTVDDEPRAPPTKINAPAPTVGAPPHSEAYQSV